MPCTPRMAGCPVSCLHYQAVTAYRQERQRCEATADNAARGYRAELAYYLAAHPLPTFRQWLIGNRRPAETDTAA
jgi:hypothetical protein